MKKEKGGGESGQIFCNWMEEKAEKIHTHQNINSERLHMAKDE